MVSFGCATAVIKIYIFFNLPFSLSTQNDKCSLQSGGIGRCIQKKNCPQLQRNLTLKECYRKNSESFVCCPIMERIVTPSATPNNKNTNQEFTTQRIPVIESTTKIGPGNLTQSIAKSKCDQYIKHKVLKRATIIKYVFGGTLSLSKEFPHMAALGYGQQNKPQWLCGGSLISEQFVLTAAHCVTSKILGNVILVRLGDLDLQNDEDDAKPQEFLISQRIIHPNYQLPSQYNDIALLKLDHAAEFTDYVTPICLEITKNLPNTDFIATGWGQTENDGALSNSLMKVHLDYFPNDICRLNYKMVSTANLPFGILDDKQICAGSYYEEKDTCQGDSGGPLQIRDGQGTLFQVGITSFGRACGIPNTPGVYTRVSYYVPWIEQIVWTSK